MPRIPLTILTILFLLSSCENKKQVAHPEDYNVFLKDGEIDEQVRKVNGEINFWQQRLKKDSGSYVNMLELASNYLRLFKLGGEIADLRQGDSLLKCSSSKLNNTDPNILFLLSQNCITQHQFKNAAAYNDAAEKAQGDLYTIRLLQFDAWMELGRYADAYKSLQSLKDKTAFDYLIRKAKWEDHNGNIENAIALMEQAFEKVKNKKKSLYCWTLSNLADMYGHAGRVKDAYKAYLDVLKKDPSNLYCLKGIAWISYSHDHNSKESKRILQYILSQTKMPDLKLILAEIAESENKPDEKKKWIDDFLTDVSQPGYGDMYNKYLITIYTEELKDHQQAMLLAKKEMENRFTPETCDWLAWAYYNKGDAAKAFEIAKGYVRKRNFEPAAIMHTAFIFAANGKKTEAGEMLKECLKSSFELGPVASSMIKEKLQTL